MLRAWNKQEEDGMRKKQKEYEPFDAYFEKRKKLRIKSKKLGNSMEMINRIYSQKVRIIRKNENKETKCK